MKRGVLCVLAALVTMTSGCALRGGTAPVSAYEPAGVVEYEEPCLDGLYRIETATHGESAQAATRHYLSCLVDSGVLPPIDLEMRVADALAMNQYPAIARDRDEVLARFFDRSAIKELPDNLLEMERYLGTLEDQALAARAMGDERLASAAEGRARRVRSLMAVLEDVQG